MATFNAYMATDAAPSPVSCSAGEVRAIYSEYSLTAALAANDVINMVKLPGEHVPVDVIAVVDDLDTGGAPAITLDFGVTADPVGTTEDSDAFIAASTIGQAGGLARMSAVAGAKLAPVANTRKLGFTVPTGPATGATTGKLRCTVFYRAQQSGHELS